MSVFRLSDAGARRVLKRSLRPVSSFVGVAVLASLGAYWVLSNNPPKIKIATILFLFAVFSWGAFRTYRKQLESWRRYQLSITGDSVVAENGPFRTLKIPSREICEIVVEPSLGVTVRTSDKYRFLVIPWEIQPIEAVIDELGKHAEVRETESERNPQWYVFLGLAAGLLMIAAFYVAMTSANRAFAQVSAVAGASGALFCAYVVAKTRTLKASQKLPAALLVLLGIVALLRAFSLYE